jgi:hypothetical protein
VAIALYDLSVANYLQTLGAVVGFLETGLAHFTTNHVDLDEIVETRLAPDMLPFRFQLQSVAHHSLGAIEGVKKGLFRPPPQAPAYEAALGFDPQGEHIAIRDEETGDDDLDTDMPDDNPDSAIGCCVGTECEDETAAECTASGGTPTPSGGCLPDPCNGNPPPATVVCCRTTSAGGAFVDDDPENECEDDVSSAECAAQGGMVVQATSCEPNPCQPTPPPNLVICCVSDGGESECEHITADECTTAGGTVNSATSCDPDPCGGGGDGGGGGGD